MPTRIFTSFMLPNSEAFEDKVRYWIDVVEDYDTVFNKVHPLQPPTSSLELRNNFFYTKLEDGLRFTCHPGNVCGFEELQA